MGRIYSFSHFRTVSQRTFPLADFPSQGISQNRQFPERTFSGRAVPQMTSRKQIFSGGYFPESHTSFQERCLIWTKYCIIEFSDSATITYNTTKTDYILSIFVTELLVFLETFKHLQFFLLNVYFRTVIVYIAMDRWYISSCLFFCLCFFLYLLWDFCFIFLVQYKKSKKLEKNAKDICYRLYIVMDIYDFIFVGSLFHILSPRLERSNFYRHKSQYYKVWLWYHVVLFLSLLFKWKDSSDMRNWYCLLFLKFQLLKFVISSFPFWWYHSF